MDSVGSLLPYVSNSVLQRLSADPSSALRNEIESLDVAALFVDVADSTRIVEGLLVRGSEGAEHFSALLNRYFVVMIDAVGRFGGEVFKFDGDAVLAVWRGADAEALADAATQAAACAFAVQEAVQALAGSVDRLSLRAGVGVGPASLIHVSDGAQRSEMFLIGQAMVEVFAAAKAAELGKVAFGANASRVLGILDGASGGAAKMAAVSFPWPESEALSRPSILVEAGMDLQLAPSLLSYVPRVVRVRASTQSNMWLAELRTLTVVFVGLDLDGVVDVSRLVDAVARVLNRIGRFGGDMARVGAHGGGVAVLAAFGLPLHSHEDDAARASRAAMSLLDELADGGIEVSIGVTTGGAFCGCVGSDTRCEYTMIGDAVNVAARLMNAARGTVLCDAATRQASRGGVLFGPALMLSPRGRSGSVEVFKPIGYGQTRRISAGALVGRESECAQLENALSALEKDGQGSIIVLEGEAGIGKSRLAMFVADTASDHGLEVVTGYGESIESRVPFYVWRAIVITLLGLSMPSDARDQAADADRISGSLKVTAIASRLERSCGLEASHARRVAPLLGDVLGSPFKDNGWTVKLSPQARVEQTAALVLRVLLSRSRPSAVGSQSSAALRVRPRVIMLEDAHWFDARSWTLLRTAAQASASLLLVVTSRPSQNADYRNLLSAAGVSHIVVGGLGSDAVAELAERRLGVATVGASLVRFLFERCKGHPFFTEELLGLLRGEKALSVYGDECRLAMSPLEMERLPIPATVEGLVRGRIDMLSDSASMVLRNAAVFGYTFTAADVSVIDPARRDASEIDGELEGLVSAGLVVRVVDRDGVFMFRHAIMERVVYDSIPFMLRRSLHRVVAERSSERGESAVVLARHWGRAIDQQIPKAEVLTRAVEAMEAGGEQCMRLFANADAIELFSEALTAAKLLPGLVEARRMSRWHRQIGEAELSNGRQREGLHNLMIAVDLLGRGLPSSRAKRYVFIASAAVRQLANRLLPAAIMAPATAAVRLDSIRVAALKEESSISGRLAYGFFARHELEAGFLSNLRALNAAESAGACDELANSAAYFGLAAGIPFGDRVAEHYFEIARRAAESIRTPSTLGRVLFLRGLYLVGRARWDEASAVLESSLGILEETGDTRWVEHVLLAMGVLMMICLRIERGLKYFSRVQHSAHLRGDLRDEAWSYLGMSFCELSSGRHQEALAMLDKAEAKLGGDLGDFGDLASGFVALGTRAVAVLREGDAVSARHLLEQGYAMIGTAPFLLPYAIFGYTFLIEVALRLMEAAQRDVGKGDRQVIAAGVEERLWWDEDVHLARMARDLDSTLWKFARRMPVGRGQAWVWRGLRLWLRGEHARARRAWARGAAVAAAMSMPYDEGLARYEDGRHRSAGDPRRLPRLEEARVLFAGIGADYWVQRVEEEMAALV